MFETMCRKPREPTYLPFINLAIFFFKILHYPLCVQIYILCFSENFAKHSTKVLEIPTKLPSNGNITLNRQRRRDSVTSFVINSYYTQFKVKRRVTSQNLPLRRRTKSRNYHEDPSLRQKGTARYPFTISAPITSLQFKKYRMDTIFFNNCSFFLEAF